MTDRIYYSPPIIPVGKSNNSVSKPSDRHGGQDFRSILNEKVGNGLKLSAHAENRLDKRGISISSAQMERIEKAVDKASQKGAKDSLVIMGDIAFVVSVTNRTIITAVDGESMKDNVFTNIDSAVIV